MASKVIKRETALMAEAFEYYYSLGDERSIAKVAEKFHKAKRTVDYWAASFNWPERVAQRDREVAAELQKKTIKDIVDTKANYRKMIKLAVKNFLDSLMEKDEEGNPKLKITNVADFERLVKLDMLLMGEYTELTKIKTEDEHVLTVEDRKALQEIAQAIKQDILNAAKAQPEPAPEPKAAKEAESEQGKGKVIYLKREAK